MREKTWETPCGTIHDWINDRADRGKLPLIFLLGLAAGHKEKHPVCLTLLVSVRHTGCYRSAAFHTFYLPQGLEFAFASFFKYLFSIGKKNLQHRRIQTVLQ